MLWDLIQQIQLGKARQHSMSIEDRIASLEQQIERNNKALVEVIKYLERRDGSDLDGDGNVG